MTTWADTKRQKDANARASRVLMASSVYAANRNAAESSGQLIEIDEVANQRPVCRHPPMITEDRNLGITWSIRLRSLSN